MFMYRYVFRYAIYPHGEPRTYAMRYIVSD